MLVSANLFCGSQVHCISSIPLVSGFHLSLCFHEATTSLYFIENHYGVLSLLLSMSAKNLFLRCSIDLVNGHKFIQGILLKIERIFVIHTCVICTYSRGPFNRFWVRKLAQNWNLMESPDFLLQQLTFPSPCQFSVFFRVTQVKEHPGIPQAISRHYRSFWSSHSVDPLVLLSLIIIISTLPLLVNCHNLAATIWNVISIVTKERNIMHHVLLSALAHRG